MIVVTPEAAAAEVPVGKSSRSGLPGSIRCTWVSTPPGSRNRPPASTVVAADGASGPTWTTTPSRTPTFRRRRAVGLTTVLPAMRRSRSGMRALLWSWCGGTGPRPVGGAERNRSGGARTVGTPPDRWRTGGQRRGYTSGGHRLVGRHHHDDTADRGRWRRALAE